MNKESWKRFITMVPGDFLVEFSKRTEVKINGFPNIHIQNVNHLRPKIFTFVSSKFINVTKKAKEWLQDENWIEYRSKQTSELSGLLETDNGLYGPITLSLLLGEDIHQITAQVIMDKFIDIVAKHTEEQNETEEETEDDIRGDGTQKQINALRKKLDSLNHRLTQALEENRKLTKEFENSKKLHREEKKKWDAEKAAWTDKSKSEKDTATVAVPVKPKRQPNIGFICSSTKIVETVSRNLWYKVEQIHQKKIEYNSLTQFDEVWIMNNDMNLVEQIEIKSALKGKTHIYIFKREEEIIKYMGQKREDGHGTQSI